MNLPILGTLSTLLTDATSEAKKLFEPWSLVSAAVLMGLALVFFYPELPADPKLDAGRIVLLTAILFALAYLVNTLGASFLALAGGRPLRDSPVVGWALLGLQRRRYDRLADDINRSNSTNDSTGEIRNTAFYRLAYEFPARCDMAPTRLGNIRAAVATYSLNQYGAHLDTVWPLVMQTLAKEDENLLQQTGAEQTATTFLATLGILLLLFGAVALPYGLAMADWRRVLAVLALWLLSYVAYRAAAVRALGWGRHIRAGLDLYLDETGTKLGLLALTGKPVETKDRWTEVSKWLAYGGLLPNIEGVTRPVDVPAAEGDWYKEKEADKSPTTLTCSAGVSATARVVEGPAIPFSLLPGGGEARLAGRQYDIILLASATGGQAAAASAPSAPTGGQAAPPATGTTSPTAGGFVMIADTRLPFLPPGITGTLHWPNGNSQQNRAPLYSATADGNDALLWPLPDLAAHGSGVLRYSAETDLRLYAGPGVTLSSVVPDGNSLDQLIVKLTYSGAAPGPAVVRAGRVDKDRSGEGFTWRKKARREPLTEGKPVYDEATQQVAWTIPLARPNKQYSLYITLKAHGHK